MAVTEAEILSVLLRVIETETGIPADEIEPTSTFAADLDVDSLALMSIVVSAEEEVDVRIPDEDIKTLLAVQDMVDYIAARVS